MGIQIIEKDGVKTVIRTGLPPAALHALLPEMGSKKQFAPHENILDPPQNKRAEKLVKVRMLTNRFNNEWETDEWNKVVEDIPESLIEALSEEHLAEVVKAVETSYDRGHTAGFDTAVDSVDDDIAGG